MEWTGCPCASVSCLQSASLVADDLGRVAATRYQSRRADGVPDDRNSSLSGDCFFVLCAFWRLRTLPRRGARGTSKAGVQPQEPGFGRAVPFVSSAPFGGSGFCREEAQEAQKRQNASPQEWWFGHAIPFVPSAPFGGSRFCREEAQEAQVRQAFSHKNRALVTQFLLCLLRFLVAHTSVMK